MSKASSTWDLLADLPPNSEAFKILDETLELLKQSNRKIRIADSSEAMNSSEGLADTTVPDATGGRSAWSRKVPHLLFN